MMQIRICSLKIHKDVHLDINILNQLKIIILAQEPITHQATI